MKVVRGYLATHFFNKFGLDGTEKLAQLIEEKTPVKLYVPHRNAAINDKKNNDESITDIAIYEADTNELLSASVVIACLDGVEIDAGVATEIGVVAGYLEYLNYHAKLAESRPRIILGYYTDMRQDGTGDNHFYINLYTKGAVNKWGKVVSTEEELIEEINKFCDKHLEQ